MGDIVNNTPYVLHPRVSGSTGMDGYINRLSSELHPGASTPFEGFTENKSGCGLVGEGACQNTTSYLNRTIIIDAGNNLYCTFRVHGYNTGNQGESNIDAPANHGLKCEINKSGGYTDIKISAI